MKRGTFFLSKGKASTLAAVAEGGGEANYESLSALAIVSRLSGLNVRSPCNT
jgi:hypothetical protein